MPLEQLTFCTDKVAANVLAAGTGTVASCTYRQPVVILYATKVYFTPGVKLGISATTPAPDTVALYHISLPPLGLVVATVLATDPSDGF